MNAGQPTEIAVSESDGVCVVEFRRPERRNAFTPVGYRELRCALESAETSPTVNVVVLVGDRQAFSSGADLDCLRDEADIRAMHTEFDQLLDTLIGLSTPLFAAVDGVAVGFGATLLLHCDVVMLSGRARLRFPFVELGTVPEAGSSFLLSRAVGAQRASELIMSGRWIDADEAVAMGLAVARLPPEELYEAVLALARTVAERPGPVTVAAKAVLREPLRSEITAARERETRWATRLADTVGGDRLRSRRAGRPTGT